MKHLIQILLFSLVFHFGVQGQDTLVTEVISFVQSVRINGGAISTECYCYTNIDKVKRVSVHESVIEEGAMKKIQYCETYLIEHYWETTEPNGTIREIIDPKKGILLAKIEKINSSSFSIKKYKLNGEFLMQKTLLLEKDYTVNEHTYTVDLGTGKDYLNITHYYNYIEK